MREIITQTSGHQTAKMFFDESRNAYVDSETGAIIPLEAGDEVPTVTDRQSAPPKPPQRMYFDLQQNAFVDPESGAVIPIEEGDQLPKESEQEAQDRALAMQLSSGASTLPSGWNGNYTPVSQTRLGATTTHQSNGAESVGNTAGSWGLDDWSLARALQAMEFEISNEQANGHVHAEGDFNEREIRASNFKRQMLTISTALVVIQVNIFLFALLFIKPVQLSRLLCWWP